MTFFYNSPVKLNIPYIPFRGNSAVNIPKAKPMQDGFATNPIYEKFVTKEQIEETAKTQKLLGDSIDVIHLGTDAESVKQAVYEKQVKAVLDDPKHAEMKADMEKKVQNMSFQDMKEKISINSERISSDDEFAVALKLGKFKNNGRYTEQKLAELQKNAQAPNATIDDIKAYDEAKKFLLTDTIKDDVDKAISEDATLLLDDEKKTQAMLAVAVDGEHNDVIKAARREVLINSQEVEDSDLIKAANNNKTYQAEVS